MKMKILIKREQRKRVCFAESEKSRTKFKNFALILMSLLMICCTKDDEAKAATVQEAGKTLVVYYSYTNNCHEIVTSLTSQIQADVMRIEPADKTMVSTNRPQKYEANGYAIGTALLNAIKAAPNDAASYPAIDPVSITDLSQYQNIIIVTPLWWSQMAAIMQTYLFNYGVQMAGKRPKVERIKYLFSLVRWLAVMVSHLLQASIS